MKNEDLAGTVPVIAVDGPSGSGKGTICQLLSVELGWHLLDSGALYRVTALAAHNHGVDIGNAEALQVLAGHLDVQFVVDDTDHSTRVVLEGEDVSEQIRTEAVGQLASEVATVAPVRTALLSRQRAFQQPPGLVADGRDMGTIVFPSAPLKIFLTASPEERADRRYLQLKSQGQAVSLPDLVADIQNRDRRDMERSIAPLRPAADAVTIDTTGMSIDQVLRTVLDAAGEKQLT